jgi:hypothetical protein
MSSPRCPDAVPLCRTYRDLHVRVGFVESIDTTINACLRRSRGMTDEQVLRPEVKRTSPQRR